MISVFKRFSRWITANKRRTNSPDLLMTSEEVAAYLGMPSQQLRKLRHDGTLPPPFEIGKRLWWKRSDVEAMRSSE